MPSIYDIDFNLQADNLNPPPKRVARITALLHSLMVPLQYLRDLLFIDYIGGVKYPPYSKFTLYNPGNRVTDNRSNYENIVQSLNKSPLDTNYWIKIQDVYLGLDQRKTYNSQKIILELVLNTYFNITPTTVPVIYITNNAVLAKNFLVFPAGFPSAVVFPAGNAQRQYAFPAGYTTSTQYNYTIYIPAALYAAINPTPATAEAIVRSLVDKYNTTSLYYNIVTF